MEGDSCNTDGNIYRDMDIQVDHKPFASIAGITFLGKESLTIKNYRNGCI